MVAQAEYNEQAYLDLLLYFVLFEHEARNFDALIFLPNILHSFMKHCMKNHDVEYGASYFLAAFYTKKCEKMSNLVL